MSKKFFGSAIAVGVRVGLLLFGLHLRTNDGEIFGVVFFYIFYVFPCILSLQWAPSLDIADTTFFSGQSATPATFD